MRTTNKGVNEDSIYSCNLHVHSNLINLTNHPVINLLRMILIMLLALLSNNDYSKHDFKFWILHSITKLRNITKLRL